MPAAAPAISVCCLRAAASSTSAAWCCACRAVSICRTAVAAASLPSVKMTSPAINCWPDFR